MFDLNQNVKNEYSTYFIRYLFFYSSVNVSQLH